GRGVIFVGSFLPRVETARARQCRALFVELMDQPLTYLAPKAATRVSETAEKPWPLQPFWPLQELAEPLQALWPLQALPAMHLPWAAFAGVDTVDTTEPARNRVAAAAASVAPDLEFNFMTISSMIV